MASKGESESENGNGSWDRKFQEKGRIWYTYVV